MRGSLSPNSNASLWTLRRRLLIPGARRGVAQYIGTVRIWDLETSLLCDKHLLGEHRELHAIWSILTTGKQGYAHHPETLRWRGRLGALFARHDQQVAEMHRRGFRHRSPLDAVLATGAKRQTVYVDSPHEQHLKLARRGCSCRVSERQSR
jgi:Pyrimidine dimer DNA glycosylase